MFWNCIFVLQKCLDNCELNECLAKECYCSGLALVEGKTLVSMIAL